MTTTLPSTYMMDACFTLEPVDELLDLHVNDAAFDGNPNNSVDLEQLICEMEPAPPALSDLWGALATRSISPPLDLGVTAVVNQAPGITRSPIASSTSSSGCASPSAITSQLHTSPSTKRAHPRPRKPAFKRPTPVPTPPSATTPAATMAIDVGAADTVEEGNSDQTPPLPSPELLVDDDEAFSGDEKRVERMMRNRASAAESRKRKRAHVSDLESLVAELRASVAALAKENADLKTSVHDAEGIKRAKGDDNAPAALPADELPMLLELPLVNSAACA